MKKHGEVDSLQLLDEHQLTARLNNSAAGRRRDIYGNRVFIIKLVVIAILFSFCDLTRFVSVPIRASALYFPGFRLGTLPLRTSLTPLAKNLRMLRRTPSHRTWPASSAAAFLSSAAFAFTFATSCRSSCSSSFYSPSSASSASQSFFGSVRNTLTEFSDPYK